MTKPKVQASLNIYLFTFISESVCLQKDEAHEAINCLAEKKKKRLVNIRNIHLWAIVVEAINLKCARVYFIIERRGWLKKIYLAESQAKGKIVHYQVIYIMKFFLDWKTICLIGQWKKQKKKKKE